MKARLSRWGAILACAAALLLAPGLGRAVDHDGTFWTGYMSTWWVDPSWGIWFDTHYNVDTFFVLRGGISHRFEAGPVVTGGYAFLLLNPNFERHEHRPWGQVFYPYWRNEKWSLTGRLRVDLRFLDSLEHGEITSDTDFIFRPRLQTNLTRRFAPTRFGVPMVSAHHEILFNAATSNLDRDVLDQNRVSLLFGLDMSYITVRVGYMNRWLPNANAGDGRFEHAAIVWFSQAIDLWKKGKARKPEGEEYPEYGGP